MNTPDVAVVGGGLIGLAIAWRCSQAGMTVTVYDPEPGRGASTVAAGMLAPVTETHFGEEPLLRLALESAGRWKKFAADLEAACGRYLERRTEGTLLVGVDDGDRGEIERLHRFYDELGLPAQLVDGERLRNDEPLLSRRVGSGVLASGDHQVDPRRVHRALRETVLAHGVTLRAEGVDSLDSVPAGTVVVAAGAWSARLLDVPVRPVRGQVLRLRRPSAAGRVSPLNRVVRAFVGGRRVYAVPRRDGEVVVGATSDERGFDAAPRAGDAYELLRTVLEVLPELSEYELAETNVGFRPGAPDNAPLLGRMSDPRVVAATGHYRQGVLLTPITADLVSELVATGRTPEALRPFDPLRFAASGGPAPPPTPTPASASSASASEPASGPVAPRPASVAGSAIPAADVKSKPRDRLPSTAGNEACGQTPSCGKPSEGSTERPTTAAEETTLNIHVNGEPTETRARTVTDVVAGLTAAHRGVAVAVNGEVVSRAEWPRALREGDRVEVLTANPGG